MENIAQKYHGSFTRSVRGLSKGTREERLVEENSRVVMQKGIGGHRGRVEKEERKRNG